MLTAEVDMVAIAWWWWWVGNVLSRNVKQTEKQDAKEKTLVQYAVAFLNDDA
jgi:hypothetical protein